MFEDICYKASFLSEVVARVDFVAPLSPVEKIVPEKFAAEVSKRFPIVEPTESIGLEFQIGGGESKQIEKRTKNWNFFGKEREKQLTLTAEALFVSYHRYGRYEDLKADFSSALQELSKAHPDARTGRLGLRYINRFDIPDLENPLDWAKYISPSLLGMEKFFDVSENLTRLFHIAGIKFEDISITLQCGMPNEDFPAVIKKPLFVLDIDAFVQIAHDLIESIQYMDKAHEMIQGLFERCITDELRARMNA